MKTVSIIIPVYNAEEHLHMMLDSVLSQTYPHIQLIIVDDGSEDGSKDVIKEYEPRLKKRFSTVVCFHNENMSASQAMNTALPHVNGEYLMWADADDLLSADNVAKKVQYLEQHPELVMVRSNGIQIDLNTGAQTELAKEDDKRTQWIFDKLMFSQTYCHCGCYMVRSDAFFSCYPQKKIAVSRQGQNMQMQLPPASLSECGYIDEFLYTYKIHSTNHSRSFVTYPQQVARANGFEEMQLKVIANCRCDIEEWAQKIKNYWSGVRDNLRREYAIIVRNKMLSEKKAKG